MKRLTQQTANGDYCPADGVSTHEIVQLLAAYENTELTPIDVERTKGEGIILGGSRRIAKMLKEELSRNTWFMFVNLIELSPYRLWKVILQEEGKMGEDQEV